MSPKRGDRATPPTIDDEWEVRFHNTAAAKGWEELGRCARNNTRKAYEAMRADPRPEENPRHHRLNDTLATETFRGVVMEQWQIEVTSGGRIWYLIDDDKHTVWIMYASPKHPKATE